MGGDDRARIDLAEELAAARARIEALESERDGLAAALRASEDESRVVVAELRAEKVRIQRYLDLAGVVFLALDTDGNVVSANKKAGQVLECRAEEIVGSNWFDVFLPAKSREETREAFRQLMEGHSELVEHAEAEVLTKRGRSRTIGWHYALLHDDDGAIAGLLTAGEDVTERARAEMERRSLERRLLDAQKLESLGVLAGGIAHDFNNLLMGILGNADLAALDLPPNSPARASVDTIVGAAKRASELTNQMLAYAGRGKLVTAMIDLGDLVREMTGLLEAPVGSDTQIDLDLAEDLPAVRGDPTQIRQVVMNLVANAAEAVVGRTGLVVVKTRALVRGRALSSESEGGKDLRPGRYVALEVTDNGCGMDEETLRKAFDPFFTTKFTGRGLGLAAVQGIVRGHNGAIKVDSRLGHGTAFTVLLPCDVLQASEPSEIGRPEEDLPLGGGVLLADDDELARTVAARMLERLGFEVFTAADGFGAVEVFRERQHEIVCAVLDLTMPGMDGEAAFQEMMRIRGDVRVILSSGYSEAELSERFAGRGLAGFIQKPYELTALRQKLSDALHRP